MENQQHKTPLHELFPIQLEEKLSQLAYKIADYAELYADKQSTAKALADRKNDRFAEVVHRSEGSTNAEKERNARLSQEWDFIREELIAAEKAALKAKIDLDVCKVGWETVRSILSSKNLERKMGF